MIISERLYGENTLRIEEDQDEPSQRVLVNGLEVYSDQEAGAVTEIQMVRRVLSAIQWRAWLVLDTAERKATARTHTHAGA